MQKRLWSPDEDEKLQNYVRTHGCGNWAHVAKQTGLNRCGKSCRLRWINYLRPDLRRGPFSVDEVRRVIHLHNMYGNSWAKIATHFSGRTDNDVKNFWHSFTRSNYQLRMQQRKDWLNLKSEPPINNPPTDNKLESREDHDGGDNHDAAFHLNTTDNAYNVLELMAKEKACIINPRVMTNRGTRYSSEHIATALFDCSHTRIEKDSSPNAIAHGTDSHNTRGLSECENTDVSQTSQLIFQDAASMSSISTESIGSIINNSIQMHNPSEDRINMNHIGVRIGTSKDHEGLHSVIWGCLNNSTLYHEHF